MAEKKTRIEKRLTPEKQREHYDFINTAISALQDLLILHKMKGGYEGDSSTPSLKFDSNWKIVLSSGSEKKGAREVQGDIENFRISKVKEELFNLLEQDESIEEADKIKYRYAINDFIHRKFFLTRKNLEIKNRNGEKQKTIFYKYHNFYKKYAKEHALEEDRELYKEICLAIASILYETNNNFLDAKTGEINEKGLQHIGMIFTKTINYVNGNNLPFHKIYHDGDFHFLKLNNAQGNPQIGTLDHYVKAIIYLIKKDNFNAYNEKGDQGSFEWYKSRKLFLNQLYDMAIMHITTKVEKKRKEQSEKEILHEHLTKKFKESTDIPGTTKSDRFKTDESKVQKHGGRTTEIRDESGIRMTYYGDFTQEEALKSIITTIRDYFNRVGKMKRYKIKSITIAKKGNFISDEGTEQIKGLLANFIESENIAIRGKKSQNNEEDKSFDVLKNEYRRLMKGTKMEPGLQEAFKIACGEITRGANGNYKDFKLIVAFEEIKADDIPNEGGNAENKTRKQTKTATKKVQETPAGKKGKKEENDDDSVALYQEISFYPETNDLNLGNHRFLELEKRIFERVNNMSSDEEFGKSISLNRVRRYTETSIKMIAYDIDKKDKLIEKGLIPKPKDDKYQYLEIDGERFHLKGLLQRTKENTELFDKIIMHVINYFIKRNKLIYINKEKQDFYGLVSIEDLHDEQNYKYGRRFTTPDVLNNIALDQKNISKSISFYTGRNTYVHPNFYNVSLKKLGKIIRLSYQLKSNN